MNQAQFVWSFRRNSKNALGIKMDDNGNTNVELNNDITITHNSTKRNKIEIIFKLVDVRFIIPDQKILEKIYKMNSLTENVTVDIYRYCEDNLARS